MVPADVSTTDAIALPPDRTSAALASVEASGGKWAADARLSVEHRRNSWRVSGRAAPRPDQPTVRPRVAGVGRLLVGRARTTDGSAPLVAATSPPSRAL